MSRFALPIAMSMTMACQRQPETNAARNAPLQEVPAQTLPVAEAPMDRSALMLAVAQAASAAALGESDSDEQRGLDGDRFELRIRFGCPGGSLTGGDGPFSIRFDQKTWTLRLRATPDLTIADPWIAALAGESAETVEGFWLARPWLLSAACPAVGEAQLPPPKASHPESKPAAVAQRGRVGIAQFFTEADSRAARRDQRPYEITKVLAEGEQPSRQGYDLVLSGRLTRLPDRHVIACRVNGIDSPPDCVVSARIDRVRLERPDTKSILAEWTS